MSPNRLWILQDKSLWVGKLITYSFLRAINVTCQALWTIIIIFLWHISFWGLTFLDTITFLDVTPILKMAYWFAEKSCSLSTRCSLRMVCPVGVSQHLSTELTQQGYPTWVARILSVLGNCGKKSMRSRWFHKSCMQSLTFVLSFLFSLYTLNKKSVKMSQKVGST